MTDLFMDVPSHHRRCVVCGKVRPIHDFQSYTFGKRWWCLRCADTKAKRRDMAMKEAACYRLGARCLICGRGDILALDIHHLNDDGKAERLRGLRGALLHIKILEMDDPNERYALLCAPCHRYEHHKDLCNPVKECKEAVRGLWSLSQSVFRKINGWGDSCYTD